MFRIQLITIIFLAGLFHSYSADATSADATFLYITTCYEKIVLKPKDSKKFHFKTSISFEDFKRGIHTVKNGLVLSEFLNTRLEEESYVIYTSITHEDENTARSGVLSYSSLDNVELYGIRVMVNVTPLGCTTSKLWPFE